MADDVDDRRVFVMKARQMGRTAYARMQQESFERDASKVRLAVPATLHDLESAQNRIIDGHPIARIDPPYAMCQAPYAPPYDETDGFPEDHIEQPRRVAHSMTERIPFPPRSPAVVRCDCTVCKAKRAR